METDADAKSHVPVAVANDRVGDSAANPSDAERVTVVASEKAIAELVAAEVELSNS